MHDAVGAVPGLLRAAATPAGLTLCAKGVVFEARARRLIDGVDLTLRDGPTTAILGPNGAGKSLLLRLLHGLLRPTRGEILWNGKPPDAGVVRRQAMVFQRPVLLRRSVAANIRYALQVHGLAGPERERRLETMLALARLEGLAERPARVLSGGEQQRLALARALSIAPDMLFLDEPTTNLDPASTLAIEELLRQAEAGGTKLVLVTHDLGQARRLAHDVVFLNHGRIAEHSLKEQFFSAPVSSAAQAFLEGRIVL